MLDRRKDRIKKRGQALSAMAKTRLLPWLSDQGFQPTPFHARSGGYNPGHDTWSYTLARVEGGDEVALLEIYLWRAAASVTFYYNRIGLTEPVTRVEDAPGLSEPHDGVLHRDHLRQRISDYGPVRRPLGLFITRNLRMRGWGSYPARANRLFDEITLHLGDLSRLRAEWQAKHSLLRLDARGRMIAGQPGNATAAI